MGIIRKRNDRMVPVVMLVVAGALIAGCATAAEQPPLDLEMYAKPGFAVLEDDGRLWVFREGSDDLAAFQESGEPAKQVVRPLAAPGGVTVKSTESATIDEYLTTLPGFYTQMEEGRLWVFKTDSAELDAFLQTGEPAKQVVRPLAGPFGLTIKAVASEVIDDYLAAWEAATG